MELSTHVEELEDRRISLKQKRDTYLPYMIGTPFMGILGGLVLGLGWFTIPLTLVALIGSIITNYTQFVQPFRLLKSKYKRAMVADIMERNHPDMLYEYNPDIQSAKDILKSSRLISGYSGIYEEDVVTGEYKSANFYFSQVNLTSSNGNGAQQNVFSGLLFRISTSTWNLPQSQIQSKRNLLQRWFSSFRKNEKFDFWYDTSQREGFFAGLSRLFPFIAHLKKKNEDVRIHTDGDQITILLKSDMDLFDDKSLKMNLSFINDDAGEAAMQQINSLLYIVDAFLGEDEPSNMSLDQKLGQHLPDSHLELRRPEKIQINRNDLKS